MENIAFGPNFSTKKVDDMTSMFASCESLTTLNLSLFNTSNVYTMEKMFNSCYNLTYLDISSFETSKCNNFNDMFGNIDKITVKVDPVKGSNMIEKLKEYDNIIIETL